MGRLVWKCSEMVSTAGGEAIAVVVVYVVVDERLIEAVLSVSICSSGNIG